jgi:NADP-dependent 3-hydroxy acid dehydrogenase YdfG
VDDALKELGQIDVIVNNAGYGLFASVEEAADDQIRREIDTNPLGSINVIRAALPHLRAQGHGRILQVSTAGGQATYPNFSYYHASMARWRCPDVGGKAAVRSKQKIFSLRTDA